MLTSNLVQRFSLTLAAVLLLSGCAGAPAPAATEAAAAEPAAVTLPTATAVAPAAEATAMTDEAMTDEAMADGAMADEAAATAEAATMTDRPAWQLAPLTDARSGATFTLADFAGKTVFVEPFATWCSNCRQQLAHVHEARTQSGADVVYVALSIEPNIGDEALAAYAADTGYDLIFAAMSPEMLQALAAQFGQTIANPPATPHFVIRPDGSSGELVTGIKSTQAILDQVAPAEG